MRYFSKSEKKYVSYGKDLGYNRGCYYEIISKYQGNGTYFDHTGNDWSEDDIIKERHSGLKDFRNYHLYEGDIISNDNDSFIGLVEFIDGAFCCTYIIEGDYEAMGESQYDTLNSVLLYDCLQHHNNLNCIGNMNENPDFIEDIIELKGVK